jgi:hypothetical protein
MMIRKNGKIGISFLAVIAAAVFLLLHSDKKKAVERLLDNGRSAMVTKNMDRLLPLISLYYKDSLGMTCGSLRAGFAYVFSQYHDIAIDYRIQSITVGKDTVEAVLAVRVSGNGLWGTSPQDIAGTSGDPEPVSILCKKEMFAWKVVGSRWPRRKALAF